MTLLNSNITKMYWLPSLDLNFLLFATRLAVPGLGCWKAFQVKTFHMEPVVTLVTTNHVCKVGCGFAQAVHFSFTFRLAGGTGCRACTWLGNSRFFNLSRQELWEDSSFPQAIQFWNHFLNEVFVAWYWTIAQSTGVQTTKNPCCTPQTNICICNCT